MSDWKNVQYKDGKYRTSEGGGGGSSTLAGLDDVSFSDLQNGQVPKYNSTTQKWENADESGGGGTVTDVEVDGTSVVDQQTGVAEITMPNVPVQDVQVDGVSVLNQQGVAEIQMPTPPTPDYPVTDVKVNGTSVVSNKQALITSYKEVTQAQYEALPDTKLNDGVLYAIKDGGQAVDGFPPLIYSDEEREIGVWRDGKPLYQKTFVVQKTTVGVETFLDLTSLNIESCVQTIGWFINSGNTHNYMPFYTSSSDFAMAYYQEGYLKGYNGGTQTKSSWNVTLQYTKTTDVAGSGTWNQQGAIAHHYSTDETVVGTYLGKPLYERTYSGLSISGSLNNYVHSGIIISDIEKVVSVPSAIDDNNQSILMKIGIYSSNNELALFEAGSATYISEFTLQYTKTTD